MTKRLTTIIVAAYLTMTVICLLSTLLTGHLP